MKKRFCVAIHHTLALFFLLTTACAVQAADININGVVGNKALVVIDGGKPRWLNSGETTAEGIKLISVNGQSAVVEFGGKRQTLTMGQNERLSGGASGGAGNQSVTLSAGRGGHFVADGSINGVPVQFLVDTGASYISFGSSEAKRIGINYENGQKSFSSTANGVVPTYRVKLDVVKVGEITLNNIDAMVHASDNLPVVLLGNSFLNRMEMKRDGEKMVLTKRF
ncbi:MAG: TIGR02281 family clan AA aspartic protease [Betaproteobacteria bacterium]|nr:TIGR02281 family clan AA aspartic protease [Betaproteobacteria bacterium]